MSSARLRVEETPRYRGAPSTTPTRLSTDTFWLPATSVQVQPGQQRDNRDGEYSGMVGPRSGLINGHQPTWSAGIRGYLNIILPFLISCGHQVVSGYPKAGNGTNAVLTISKTGTVSGGTFTITVDSNESGAIPVTATAAEIQAWLNRLPNVLPGDIVVTGGPATTTDIVLTFEGRMAAQAAPTTTVDDASVTGGGTLAIATTTSGAVGSNTDSLGNGATSGAYIWELEPRNGAAGERSANTPLSFQLDADYGDPWLFAQGCGASQVQMGTDGAFTMSGPALYAERYLADPSMSPSYDAPTVHPIMFRDLEIDAWGGAAVCDIRSFSWGVDASQVAEDSACTQGGWPDRLYFDGNHTVLSGTVDTSVFNKLTWDHMMAADTFAMTASYLTQSEIGSTGVPYTMRVRMPAVQLGEGGGPEALEAKRRHGGSWPWTATLDASAGYSHRIIIVNAVSAVETYS